MDAAILEQVGQDAVGDCRADLALDIVADDRQAGVAEALGPIGGTGDKHRNTVDKTNTRLDCLLDVPFCGHFGADRQEIDDDVGLGVPENADHIVCRAFSLGNHRFDVLAQTIVSHAPRHRHVEERHIGELDGVVGVRPNGLAQVLADLALDHVERGGELDVADMVAANRGVHQTWNLGIIRGVLIILHTLNQCCCAVANTDDCNTNLFVSHWVCSPLSMVLKTY